MVLLTVSMTQDFQEPIPSNSTHVHLYCHLLLPLSSMAFEAFRTAKLSRSLDLVGASKSSVGQPRRRINPTSSFSNLLG